MYDCMRSFLVQDAIVRKAVDVCACIPDRDGPGEAKIKLRLLKCVNKKVKERFFNDGGNINVPHPKTP